jgi:hypothetical protein
MVKVRGSKEKVERTESGTEFKNVLEAPVDYIGRAKPKLAPHEFWCVICQKIYNKGWSDEEAAAEKSELHPNVPYEECDMVCDDCFVVLEEWRKENDGA